MEFKKGNHSVYLLTYHVVFVVKYRRPCITEEMGKYLVEEAAKLLSAWEGELVEGKPDRDHLHLLVSMNPKYELSRYMGVLKQTLARNVKKRYRSQIESYLWGGAFWSESYFIASTGGAPLETIQKYIEDQGREKRRYKKRKQVT